MAVVTITSENKVLKSNDEIERFLGEHGIWYRQFDKLAELSDDATDEEILTAFDRPIREQMDSGGYKTADVVDLKPTINDLDSMLARFSSEHWHSEDEVRFIVKGRGVFHINPRTGPVFRIEMREGDMINVPKGTYHWFDLCEEKRIRCIRLFEAEAGWTPHYSDSGEEAKHEPVCLGPAFVPPGA